MSAIPLTGIPKVTPAHISDEMYPIIYKLKCYRTNTQPKDRSMSNLLELALEASLQAKTNHEQEEIERSIYKYNPIMWDMIKDATVAEAGGSYPDFIRRAILTYAEDSHVFNMKYQRIIKPHRWGFKLKPEHRKYSDFVIAVHERDLLPGLIILGVGGSFFVCFVLIIIHFISKAK